MGELFSGNRAVQEQSRLLFRCILASQPMTRPMALSQLNLPPTSLNRALDRLMAAGLIEDAGQAESTGGRPASRFRIRRGARHMLGISLSGQPDMTVRLVLLDLSLEPVARMELDWQPGSAGDLPADGANAASLDDAIVAAAADLLAGSCVPAPDGSGSGSLTGIGIDGADRLADDERHALQARLAERFACTVFCDDGLTGAAYLLARTAGAGAGAVGLLSLDRPISLIPANRPAASDQSRSGPSVAAFPVLDQLGDREPVLRPLQTLLTTDAIGQRFAMLRDQASLGFDDFLLACQLQKKKAMRLLDSTAYALAQAALGIACVSGLGDIVVSGALADAFPPLIPAAAARIARLGQSFDIPVRMRLQPYGADLRAAGIAAGVLAHALEAPLPEHPAN